MADNPIKYSDLLQPDESITKAISQLEQLSATYEAMLKKVNEEAIKLEVSIKKVSGATSEGQAKTKQAATDADKLAAAQEKLRQSQSNTGVELAKLRDVQSRQNQLTKLELKLNQSKEGSYNKLSAQYSIMKIKLNAMSEAQRKGTAAGQKMETQSKKLYEEMNRLQKSTGKAQLQVGQYERGMNKATVGLKKLLGAFGLVGGIQIFARAIKDAAKLIKDYESSNAELAGVLGTNYDGTEKLRKASQELGKSTKFTAKEVTNLQIELARMGKTESEIIQMSQGIVNGTIALRAETGETAALVAATLNAYGLEANESSRITDVLTLSTQRSALSFEKLNNALPTVAGAAAAAGYSLEQTVSMLGQAADRGIDASTSATSLRNIFLELSKKGLTLDEALSKINGSQDKLSAANELFGKRAAVTALALASTTDKTKALTYALENAGGTAEQVAKTQMDTLEGRLQSLNSAYEGLVLSISSGQTSIGAFVNDSIDAMTKLLRWMGDNEEALGLDLYSDEAKKKTENALEWEKRALEKHIESTTAIYDEGMLERAASINTFQRKAAFMLNSADYDILPDGFSGNIMTHLSKMQAEYNSLAEAKQKLVIVNKALNGELEKESKLTEEAIPAISDEKSEKTGLIAVQEKLLAQAKSMSEATEAEIWNKNRKISTIENEIKRLKELGKTKDEVEGLKTLGMTDTFDAKAASSKLAPITQTDQPSVYESMFTLTDEAKDAMIDSAQFAMDMLSQVADARVKAADEAVTQSEREVDARRNNLNNEIASRNAGYASNVSMAQKELALAQKNQDKALQEQEKARKAKAAIDSVQQGTNLVTASALIWAQLGFPWAIPALAVMWGSFAYSKVKAAQITKRKESYGDGTVELLQGGSHQSGNDIDFGSKPDGTQRKAEGGEFFAVLNKRSSRKYRKLFPEVVRSLNQGVFEKKYGAAFDVGGMTINLAAGNKQDIKQLENDVRDIKQQGEKKMTPDGKGGFIIHYKNLTTYVN